MRLWFGRRKRAGVVLVGLVRRRLRHQIVLNESKMLIEFQASFPIHSVMFINHSDDFLLIRIHIQAIFSAIVGSEVVGAPSAE
jgi:hypothetical protein